MKRDRCCSICQVIQFVLQVLLHIDLYSTGRFPITWTLSSGTVKTLAIWKLPFPLVIV